MIYAHICLIYLYGNSHTHGKAFTLSDEAFNQVFKPWGSGMLCNMYSHMLLHCYPCTCCTVCPWEALFVQPSSCSENDPFMLNLATRGFLCGYLMYTHFPHMHVTREVGFVKQMLLAAGRRRSSLWTSLLLSRIVVCERVKTEWHQRETVSLWSVHPLPPTTWSLGWRSGSCMRLGNRMHSKGNPDIIAYLWKVAELVSVLAGINASINQQSPWGFWLL